MKISLVQLLKNYGNKGLKSYIKLKLGHISYHRFKNDICETVYVPGYERPILLRSHTTDFSTFKQIFHLKEYDIKFNFTPTVIIDAGANIGLASLFFNNRFPNALVYAIEPESTNFAALKNNVYNFPNIIIHHAALHHTANLELQLFDRGIGHWGFSTQKIDSQTEMERSSRVGTISIDSLMTRYEINCIDILKIDIEGAENELFTSYYSGWLPKTRCIIIEFHDQYAPGSEAMIRKILNSFGFCCFKKGENWVFLNYSFVENIK